MSLLNFDQSDLRSAFPAPFARPPVQARNRAARYAGGEAAAYLRAPARDARADLRADSRAEHCLLRLQVPQFPLRVLLRGVVDAPPCALVTDDGGVARIWLAGAAALRRGVCNGIDLRTALALCPELQVLARDPAREQRVADELSAWWLALGCRELPDPSRLMPASRSFPAAMVGAVVHGAGRSAGSTTREQAEGGDLDLVLVAPRAACLTVRLQHDLRALGFRVRLEDITPGPGEWDPVSAQRCAARQRPGLQADTLDTELVLPWPARSAQALHVAVSCLFDGLRVHAQARSAPLVRVGCSFTRSDGGSEQYVLDWPAPVRANETLVRQARERLLRHPPAGPIARLALRATFAPG